MSNCIEKIKTDECLEERDEGYERCSLQVPEIKKTCNRWKQKCKWYTFWNCIIGWFCDAASYVIEWVCKATEWVKSIVCIAWKYIEKFVCVAIDVITTILGAIVVIYDFVIGIVGGFIGLVLGIILAIPVLGSFLGTVFNIIKTAFYAIISIPDAILTIIGILPEKKLRLLVIIQKDARGIPVVHEKEMDIVKRYIQYAMHTFRQEVNVRLVQVRFFAYNPAFQEDTTPLEKFIDTNDTWRTDQSLDVCCDLCAYGQDLALQGSVFNMKMSVRGFLSSGRRLLGYGAPVIAFAVRSFSDGKAGCSLGPLSDYVTIRFNTGIDTSIEYGSLTPDKSLDAVTDLAHEIGHACSLPHKEDATNLMNHEPNRTGQLTIWQKILVRSSRHVTYL